MTNYERKREQMINSLSGVTYNRQTNHLKYLAIAIGILALAIVIWGN